MYTEDELLPLPGLQHAAYDLRGHSFCKARGPEANILDRGGSRCRDLFIRLGAIRFRNHGYDDSDGEPWSFAKVIWQLPEKNHVILKPSCPTRGARGLKLVEVDCVDLKKLCRAPHGARGLKLSATNGPIYVIPSTRPARGAWIE
jgi:hypothetical protein